MIGSWAGELGQTQFLPAHYVNFAVDYDGDGRRNLLRSAPDVIGSTANYIATGLKWRRGEPWLEEVHAPNAASFPWDQADLAIQLPRAKWAQLGVTYADGRALPNDNLPASLLLPMGRTGPAFLAYANFAAYTEWNNSLIYSTTAGYLASRIAGAAPMRRPAVAVAQLPFNEIKELQQLLVRASFTVGKVDGVLGQQSREGDAGEIRPAGGFLADRRTAGAHAWHAARSQHVRANESAGRRTARSADHHDGRPAGRRRAVVSEQDDLIGHRDSPGEAAHTSIQQQVQSRGCDAARATCEA
jgi:hypothetical protein